MCALLSNIHKVVGEDWQADLHEDEDSALESYLDRLSVSRSESLPRSESCSKSHSEICSLSRSPTISSSTQSDVIEGCEILPQPRSPLVPCTMGSKTSVCDNDDSCQSDEGGESNDWYPTHKSVIATPDVGEVGSARHRASLDSPKGIRDLLQLQRAQRPAQMPPASFVSYNDMKRALHIPAQNDCSRIGWKEALTSGKTQNEPRHQQSHRDHGSAVDSSSNFSSTPAHATPIKPAVTAVLAPHSVPRSTHKSEYPPASTHRKPPAMTSQGQLARLGSRTTASWEKASETDEENNTPGIALLSIPSKSCQTSQPCRPLKPIEILRQRVANRK